MDRKIERERRENRHKTLDMKQIQKQFRERLAASKKRGEERCRIRKERQEEGAKQNKPKLYQSKVMTNKPKTPDQTQRAWGNYDKRMRYNPQVKITPKKSEPKYTD